MKLIAIAFFQLLRQKNLGIILDYFFHITIQSTHQQILFCFPLKCVSNPSILHHPHHHNLVPSHFLLIWIIAIVSLLFSLLPLLTPIVWIDIVWSCRDINQIRSLLWLPIQSQSQSLSNGLRALVQWFPMNTLTSAPNTLPFTYSASTELSSISRYTRYLPVSGPFHELFLFLERSSPKSLQSSLPLGLYSDASSQRGLPWPPYLKMKLHSIPL